MNDFDDYDETSIRIPNWPDLVQRKDQKWQRIWHLTLCTTLNDTADVSAVEKKLSNEEISVKINVEGKRLRVTVLTDRWGWDDDLIGHSYKVFQTIDEGIGRIQLIQDQERDEWPPWSRNTDSNKK